MKTVLVFAAVVSVALAYPEYPYRQPTNILPPKENSGVYVTKEVSSDNDGLHNTRFSYEQSDGQFRDESAEIVRNEYARSVEDSVVYRVTGKYGWVDPATGKSYIVTYTADENGFHPHGDHLPTV